jgi:hypothetical protein
MVRWAPEPVWMEAENLAHTGVRSRDLPARSAVAKLTALRAVTKLVAVCFQYHTKAIKTTLGRDSQLMYVTSFSIWYRPNLVTVSLSNGLNIILLTKFAVS